MDVLRGAYALRSALDQLVAETVAGGRDSQLARACAEAQRVYRDGRRFLICGNGGSAADAQHLAAELVGRFTASSKRPPHAAIALSSDPSVLTCIANDFGYDQVFSRQVRAQGKAGDLLVAISTSGRSPSVVQAAVEARARGMRVLVLTGGDGGELVRLASVAVVASSTSTATIQEVHGVVIHAMCEAIEREAADGDSQDR